MIGRLRRVHLREVWKHEALDFTTWLQDNIDVVNEITGLSLSDVKREQAAGSFSVDLIADDGSGNIAIIENQLEKSNHDHLGKLITYLTAFDAKTAVWIVSNPRPEHIAAVAWLNESTAASFFLLKVEAVRIEESPPAPLLTLIVSPSEEGRAVGETKQEFVELRQTMRQFWSSLLEKANQRTTLHRNVEPGNGNWLSAPSGIRGVLINYIARAGDARVELYINVNDYALNRLIFDQLFAHKSEIESAFGHKLVWDKHKDRQTCKIEYPLSVGGYRDRDRWDTTQQAMIDAMIRFEQALRPFLDGIQI